MSHDEAAINAWEEWDGSAYLPVVEREIGAFLYGDDANLKADMARILRRMSKVAEGRVDPVVDVYEEVEGLGEEVFSYPSGGLVGLYAIDGPARGKRKRTVTILRIAASPSEFPAVADAETAKERLRVMRRMEPSE